MKSMSLGEIQYDTGIPQFIYPHVASKYLPSHHSLGESQYDLGLPQFIYPQNGLGQLFTRAVSSYSSTTTARGTTTSISTGPSAFEQIGGLLGNIGQLGLGFFQAYNDKSINKDYIKSNERIETIKANLAHLGAKDQLATAIEIEKLQQETNRFGSQLSTQLGVSITKIISLAVVSSIGVGGLFYYLTKKG